MEPQLPAPMLGGSWNMSWAAPLGNSTPAGALPPVAPGVVLLYLLVCALGLGGNTLVIYVVLRHAKMKTVTNIYILNLAVADVLFMLGLPFLATQYAVSYWPFGSFLCRLVTTLDGINQFTSIFCLTVMSVDRYLAVVHPVRGARWRRPQVARTASAAVWAFSLLMSLPLAVFADVQEGLGTCNLAWPEPVGLWSTVFIVYTAVLGFFGPLLVICLCYLLLLVRVKASGVRVGARRRRRSERKATRMVVVVVLVFAGCWLPFFVVNIVNLAVVLPEEPVSTGAYFFVVILSYANSCANPVLYAFLSDNFRQSFRKVLCRPGGGPGTDDADTVEARPDRSGVPRSPPSAPGPGANGLLQTSTL